jgi:hypothetical protein
MNLTDFKNFIDSIYNRVRNPSDITVGIEVYKPNSIGGTPISNITRVTKGFDFDNNKVIIQCDQKLHNIEADEIAQLRKSVEDLGWTAYEFNRLKAENKRLRTLIEKYEND